MPCRFDERSYDALDASGVGWQVVLEVLRARPRLRQHIGAVLRIAASQRRPVDRRSADRGDDDEYLVVSARELDAAEQQAVRNMIEGDAG
jgi:hypothetical protein